MYYSINMSFKHTETGNTIEQYINLNTRINELRDVISNNVSMNFNLEINTYDIVEACTDLCERNNPIDENINYSISHVYKNRIKNVCFYIRPHERLTSNNHEQFDCPICYENIPSNNFMILQCNHGICISCNDHWDNTCSENGLNRTCPICRAGY